MLGAAVDKRRKDPDMFFQTRHTSSFLFNLAATATVTATLLGASACGGPTEPFAPDTDGAFGAEVGDTGSESGTESSSGAAEGGDAGNGSGDGGDEAAGESDTTGAETSGPEPLFPDPDESRLACVDSEGELIAICDDDQDVHANCDATFAAACDAQGGTLDDPEGHGVGIVPCSADNDILMKCNDTFTNGCTLFGGTYECYWKQGDVCMDGHCDTGSIIPQ